MIQGSTPLGTAIHYGIIVHLPALFLAIMFLCAFWVIHNISTKHKHWDSKKKLKWIICAILFNVFTAVFYYVQNKKKRL